MILTRFVFALLSCVLFFASFNEIYAGSCQESFVKREITNSREITEISDALTRAFLKGNAKLPQSNAGVTSFIVIEIVKGLPVDAIPHDAPVEFTRMLGEAMAALHKKYDIPIFKESLPTNRFNHMWVDGVSSALIVLLQLKKFYENGKDPSVERFIEKEDFPTHIIEVGNPKYFDLAKEQIHEFLTSHEHRDGVAELKEIILFFKDIMESDTIGTLSKYWRKTYSRRNEHEEFAESAFRSKDAMAPVYNTLYQGLQKHFGFEEFNAMNLVSILLRRSPPYKIYPSLLDVMEQQNWPVEYNPALQGLKKRHPNRSLQDIYKNYFGVKERAGLNEFYKQIEGDLLQEFVEQWPRK